MISKMSYLLFTGVIGLSFIGCSSGGDFRGGAIGVSRNDKSKDESDEEDEKADEPVEVSGSFLTCAFMDSQAAVIDKAKVDPKGSLEVACGLYRNVGDGFGRIDDTKLKLQTRVLNNKGKLILVDHRRIEGQMQLIASIPVELLSGTIHVDYYDPLTGTYSSRRKSIPTITEFMAKIGFSVNDDESVGRFIKGEFLTDGRIDPADSVVPTKKLDWWALLVPIIVQAFGEEASVTASNDNGATVYRPKDKNTKVVIQSNEPIIKQQQKPKTNSEKTDQVEKQNVKEAEKTDPSNSSDEKAGKATENIFVPVNMQKPQTDIADSKEKPAVVIDPQPAGGDGAANSEKEPLGNADNGEKSEVKQE